MFVTTNCRDADSSIHRKEKVQCTGCGSCRCASCSSSGEPRRLPLFLEVAATNRGSEEALYVPVKTNLSLSDSLKLMRTELILPTDSYLNRSQVLG
jgi:hypothetical protein